MRNTPLKTKDEVLKNFVAWKTQLELQLSKKVKYLRIDNGLEYCNEQFNKFCRYCGISRHKIVAYTPQQNGMTKRMNRTLMKKVRCLPIVVVLP